MSYLHLILIIVVAIVPAAASLYAVHLIVKKFFEKEHAEKVNNFKQIATKQTLPLRLQAAERMVLYLERTNPVNSVLVFYKPGMSAKLLQSELTKQIRKEFDHNIAQQVYMSDEAWGAVKNSKEETIKIINIAGQQVGQDGSGIDLSNKIFEIMTQLSEAPTDTASRILKREVRRLF